MTGDEHIDLDTLADYAEGERDEGSGRLDEAAIRSHLAQCAECRARADQLAEVQRTLAAAPDPAMPADVTTRIDKALAEAEEERTVTPLSRQERRAGRSRSWRLGGVAASVALVLVGGVFGIRALDLGGGSAGSGAASSDGVASLSQEGSTAPPGIQPQAKPQPSASEGVAAKVTVSGRDYGSQRLDRQAANLLDDQRAETGSPGVQAQAAKPVPTPLRSLSASSELARCVSRVTGSGNDDVLAVDFARYSGQPSAVIVADAKSGARTAQAEVWVVNPSCSRVRAHTEIASNHG